MRIVMLTNQDDGFYALLGPFLSRREVVRELGAPVWDDDGKEWYVALSDEGNMLGFGALLLRGKSVVLCSHYVLPTHRRTGVFSRLLDSTVARAQSLASRVEAIATKAALDHYMALGFTPVRETKNFTKVVLA